MRGVVSVWVVSAWFFSPVSAVEDQSEPEVGGRVEGTGLSGSRRLLRGSGGKRTFPQVLPVGAFLHGLQPLLHPRQRGVVLSA